MGVDETLPAVISVNFFAASVAVNDFLARLNDYRSDGYAWYAELRASLSHMAFYPDRKSQPPPRGHRHRRHRAAPRHAGAESLSDDSRRLSALRRCSPVAQPPGGPLRLAAAAPTGCTEELPERLSPSHIYIVGERGEDWFAAMSCPCGCGATIDLNLVPPGRPCWTLTIHPDGSPTLSPSVWRRGPLPRTLLRQARPNRLGPRSNGAR